MKKNKQDHNLTLIIFVALVVVMGLIFFAKRNTSYIPTKATVPTTAKEDLSQIQEDLNSTNLDQIDSQLSLIE